VRPRRGSTVWLFAAGLLFAGAAAPARAQVLDPQKFLDKETFWDNRDWDWYKHTIPFFECPDPDIQTTYYYRWELVTKHLTYGSPDTGYTFTEFIDRPFWSGTYGAISCPAGHQLYEVRWLRDPRYARDFARYWFRTPGAQPRRYSTWLADAVRAADLVHPDPAFVRDLLPDLVRNYEAWEKEKFDPAVGLFWQSGHDDGMEYNINSRQSPDPNAGAPGYRPTLNTYMAADAAAIALIAEQAGDIALRDAFARRAAVVQANMVAKLWDPQRQFFFHMARRDETAGGHTVKAGSLTHQTGKFAGSPFGRELIGYVPWQFAGPAPSVGDGATAAWAKLVAADGFAARFGPTTTERKDPLFRVSPTCCWWSGNSWPYATTQVLKAMPYLLRHRKQTAVTRADYLKLLTTYARTHRKDGKPYLAEACHPDTGSWDGHDSYNHSEHYFHSGFCDLVITGLVGLEPSPSNAVVVAPLAPDDWPYFALDGVPYKGYRLTILWDRDGSRYGRGKGLTVFADGEKVAGSEKLERLGADLPVKPARPAAPAAAVNLAVSNDGHYYPRASSSYTATGTSPVKAVDGNYWYHVHPPNRWTCAGSPNGSDWIAVDFGTPRRVHTVKLYPLDDGAGVVPPDRVDLEYWDGKGWAAVPGRGPPPKELAGRRAHVIRFPELETRKLRAVLRHAPGGKAGLTEFEAWGDVALPVKPAPVPPGNLAVNPGGKPFPKASASHTSRFDKVEMANDGVVSFQPTPHNRWTSYESKADADWLEIDFGSPKEFARVELALYADRGGVRTPKKYFVQTWDGSAWKDVSDARYDPIEPAGGQFNEVRFAKVRSAKVRVVFTHRDKAKSGVSELFVWPE
jgi:hypothetical protein